MSLGRDSLFLWPMALLLLCFRLVTSALSRAAHRDLSKGQVFFSGVSANRQSSSFHQRSLPAAVRGSFNIVSPDSWQTGADRQLSNKQPLARKSAAIDTKHIRLRQSSQFISKSLVKGEIFWIQGVPHPSALIEMAIIAVFASDTCLGMICSSCSLQHLFHKSLRRTRVRRGDVTSQAALIRNALALIFQ